MEKAGLKTFVYSFVFSLFTLFSVNGVYLYGFKNRSPETKIPSKNITLFLKDISLGNENIQAAPTKKIALSVLPEPSQKEVLSEQIPFSDDVLPSLDPVIQVASADIPLQGTLTHTKNQSNEQIDGTEKIIGNFDQIIKSRPVIDNIPKAEDIIPDSSEESSSPSQSPSQHLPLADETQIAMNIVYSPETAGPLKTDSTPSGTSLSASSAAKKMTDDPIVLREIQPLIPLEKAPTDIKLAQNEVKTTSDIKENQVALNAHDVPIKSMLNAEQKKEKTSEPDSKWQSMTEKKTQNNEENPWVVAKGSKFPKNEMVLQDAAYKQDETEIKRILSPNTLDADDSSRTGTIKLAAETAKNLLIPIPKDIMEEKNITPQLVSSNKNSAEEELAAKEALHEDIQREQEEQNASEEKKSGGLLNSLTSIFSGKKSSPQIGDSVETPPENQNSLLSAFTRKSTRHTAKILPTEIRLSFQPNRAEISGQTLKWIRAFAQKTAEEAAIGLEIRIDGTSSPLLQRRRLNLLQNILMNEGADQSKIRTVFTAREPNSFILRTIRINNENTDIPQNRNVRAKSNYMQW